LNPYKQLFFVRQSLIYRMYVVYEMAGSLANPTALSIEVELRASVPSLTCYRYIHRQLWEKIEAEHFINANILLFIVLTVQLRDTNYRFYPIYGR